VTCTGAALNFPDLGVIGGDDDWGNRWAASRHISDWGGEPPTIFFWRL
jgi:hypothetical protein